MKKSAAIALARSNGVPVKSGGLCRFSNVVGGTKNVWWLDIPVGVAKQGVTMLLCDGQRGRLHCLDVPGRVFQENSADFFREEVRGVDKFRIEPSASAGQGFMKDLRSHSAGVCFCQFERAVVDFNPIRRVEAA